LRRTLLSLDAANVIEAIEEFRPPHFHVAVFPAPYTQHVRRRGGTVRVAAATTAGRDNYRVRSGDSLWAIARRHGTTVDRLRTANRLSSSTLRPGQELVIPGR
jgi:Tfp pilus assembly protein FimV